MVQTKKTKRNSKPPVGGSSSGSGVAARVLRVPRHVFTTNTGTLRQLGVLPASISGVRGEIRGIAAPDGSYESFFMDTTRGSAMLVTHQGGRDGQQAPDDAMATDLVDDIRQIHDDGEVPDTMVMHVARADEAAARATLERAIELINADADDGALLRLDEVGPPEPLADGSVALTFSVALRDGDDAGPPRVPDRDDLAVPPDRDDDEPPPLPVRDDVGVPDDGDDVPVGGAQPPVGGVPNANQAAVVPQAPPDDPDADLRPVVRLVGITSVDDFKRATRERSLGGRTAGYERMVGALEAYHRDLADYEREAETIRTEVEAIGADRTAHVSVVASNRAELAEARKKDLNDGLRLTDLLTQLRDDTIPATDRTEFERQVDQVLREGIDRRDEIARLERDTAAAVAAIRTLDDTLNRRLQLDKQVMRRYRDRLDGHGADLLAASTAYLGTKKISATDAKQTAVRNLINQVSDPDQHLQRVKETSRTVWGVDFEHRLAAPARLLNSGTASEVFHVETNGTIGDPPGRFGFAKRSMREGEMQNTTTINLGIPASTGQDAGAIEQHPNLIARQVVSSRLAKALGLSVIADELFSADADGRPIGITATARGTQVRQNLAIPAAVRVRADGTQEVGDTVQVFGNFNLRDPRIQKNLSDLQLMDALTGQMDRHLGNIFIDSATGTVTGIDNDMAFAIDRDVSVTESTLSTFEGRGANLRYTQDQISGSTAARILALDEATLGALIRGQDGDPERLGDSEVERAVTRLRAIKARIQELQGQGGLIDDGQWGQQTYDDAIANGTRQAFNRVEELNYVVRAQQAYDDAGVANDPFRMQAAQGV